METTARFIGKCRNCKGTFAREYTEQREVSKCLGFPTYTFVKRLVFGRTSHQGRFIEASQDGVCPSCGFPGWNNRRILGRTSEKKCDTRCTDAKGHNCECACGGKNHGSAHIPQYATLGA